VIPVVPDQNGLPKLVHDWARRVRQADISGTIKAMSRHRSSSLPLAGAWDDESDAPRLSRSSALLVGLALICAAATVFFGIWMAEWVPSTSIG
jgi:hypothetical protein